MSVDADTVRRIAHLARMAVADDEVEPLRGELNAILAFVEQLSEVDVAGVEPMTSVTPMALPTVATPTRCCATRQPAKVIISSFRRWWSDAFGVTWTGRV
jgi:aspartyl/glutamyl-tRNA(Asn/Gln) amidotransferase C subunit